MMKFKHDNFFFDRSVQDLARLSLQVKHLISLNKEARQQDVKFLMTQL